MIALTNPKTMMNFGEYQLYYQPSEWGEGSMDPSITMKISAEANLSQMLQFFESFLRAAGYQLDGQTLALREDSPAEEFSFNFLPGIKNDFWEDDGTSVVGNPYISTRVPGGEDHINFNGCFGSNAVTFA